MNFRKCKRFIKSKGEKCGARAERRVIRGQLVGTFCFPCWLEVVETLPIEFLFNMSNLSAGQQYAVQQRGREVVHAEIQKVKAEYEKILKAEAYGESPAKAVKDFVDAIEEKKLCT